ncbi:MAG: hypothetical protein KME05_17690 [Gloeocapsa sp. UFS-A4-WI-NPMV-4B04]|nr:hypothetical protein [Gloeocapsa sp. UFS-A4-WI-NPMV-4B04]
MTSTSMDAQNESVATFKSLPVDEQLAALALIYTEVSGSITSATLKRTSPEVAIQEVHQIEHMSQQEQLLTLRDLLTGAGSSPITLEYQSLDTNTRLSMWYQLAQKMGSAIATIPNTYTVSSQLAEFLNSLKSMDFEHLVSFLSSVV